MLLDKFDAEKIDHYDIAHTKRDFFLEKSPSFIDERKGGDKLFSLDKNFRFSEIKACQAFERQRMF